MAEKMATKEKTITKSEPAKESSIKKWAGWIFGVIIVWSGISILTTGSLGGLFFIAAGAVFLPPVINFLEEKKNIKLTLLKKVGLFFLFIIVGSIFYSPPYSNSTLKTESNPIQNAQNSQSTKSITPPEPSIEELKSSAITVSYDELFRNNEKYVGKVIHFKIGQIIQVIGDTAPYDFRVNVSKSFFDDEIIYLDEYTGSRLLENDIVDVYAKVTKLYTYTAVMGNSVTIPRLTVISITRKIDSANTISIENGSCDTKFGPFTITQGKITPSQTQFIILNQNGEATDFSSVEISSSNEDASAYEANIPLTTNMSANETTTITIPHPANLVEGEHNLTFKFTYDAGLVKGATASGNCIVQIQ